MLDIIIITAFFAIILLGILIIYILKAPKSNGKFDVLRKLESIDKHAQSMSMNDMKTALIQADSLLDMALKERGLPGDTLGARLKNAKTLFKWQQYNTIWEAHKMRNKVVHELEYNPPVQQLKKHYIELRLGIKHLMKT